MFPWSRGLLRVTGRLPDRQLQGGEIGTVDVGSGSKVPVRRQRKESLAGRHQHLVDLPVHPAAAERQVPRHSGQPPGEPAKVRCLRPRPFARASWPPAPSLWLTLTTHRQAGGGTWAGVTTAGGWPEVPGSIALEVSKYLMRLPRLRPRQAPHWTRGSSRIWTSGSLESLSKHKKGLEVRRHVNSKLLTRIPKRTQPDRLVDQRIRRRK